MPIEVPDPEHGTPGCPLRIAVLVKQVPVGESLTLGPDGRLQREDGPLEMNPYCRRAVSKGVELARATGGICTVFTMGPDSASDVLREAVAWGADTGVHLCDPAFAGSDTLATARALTAALSRNGPFDLIVVGRNTVDGETGQVGPELAQLLDLPFAAGVRQLELTGRGLSLGLEQDDGWTTVELALPALISAAERLCEPCKVGPEGRAAVAADRIVRRTAAELGAGPWGQSASPTWVGAVRVLSHERLQHRLSGPVSDQVREAVAMLGGRGALGTGPFRSALGEPHRLDPAHPAELSPSAVGPVIGVVLEPDRAGLDVELLGAASRLAGPAGGQVVALCPDGVATPDPGRLGAHHVVELRGEPVEEDVAASVTGWAAEVVPWVVLAPGTTFGREVAARTAAALGAGLVGDAIGLHADEGGLVSAKPAFAGALVADITCTSPVQLVTVRPGVLPPEPGRRRRAAVRSGR